MSKPSAKRTARRNRRMEARGLPSMKQRFAAVLGSVCVEKKKPDEKLVPVRVEVGDPTAG